MIRNGQSWELAEPELNDRGLPIIHDIAEKLGSVRRSPNLSYTFPEGTKDLAILQAGLFPTRIVQNDGISTPKNSEGSVVSRMGYSPTSAQRQPPAQNETDQSQSLFGDCSPAGYSTSQINVRKQEQKRQQEPISPKARKSAPSHAPQQKILHN